MDVVMSVVMRIGVGIGMHIGVMGSVCVHFTKALSAMEHQEVHPERIEGRHKNAR